MTLLPGHRLAAGRLRFVPLIVLGSSTALLEIRLAQAASNTEFQAGFMRQSPAHTADAGALALAALVNSSDLGPGRYWVDIQVNSNKTPNSLAVVDRIFHALIGQAKALLDDIHAQHAH